MRRFWTGLAVGALALSPLPSPAHDGPEAEVVEPRQEGPSGAEHGVAGLAEGDDSSEPAEPADTPVFYETTTVTARPVSSSSGSVTVITAEELEASEARSGTEVLREVPGLHLLSTGGRTGITHAWIRGGDPNFTLVLLDGIPLNDTTDRQGGAVNLEELPRGLIDRAEVVRGPRSSFYGMSSLSGVVQLFSPRGGPGPLRHLGDHRLHLDGVPHQVHELVAHEVVRLLRVEAQLVDDSRQARTAQDLGCHDVQPPVPRS